MNKNITLLRFVVNPIGLCVLTWFAWATPTAMAISADWNTVNKPLVLIALYLEALVMTLLVCGRLFATPKAPRDALPTAS